MKEQDTEVPIPPDKVELPKLDLNDQYLKKWKKLFTNINSDEIEVFLIDDEDFPKGHSFGRVDFWRLEGIGRQDDVRLVLKFSGYLRVMLGSYGCCMKKDESFFEKSIHAVDEEGCDHMDTLGEKGLITWKEMYNEILEYENMRRSEIPEPPKKE